MGHTLALSMTFAAVTAVPVWLAPSAAADPHPLSVTYAIGKCVTAEQPATAEPTSFDYNCDGTGVLEDMNWTEWGRDGARGTGEDSSIECQPNCAEGARLTNPVVVHAWNPTISDNPECPAATLFYRDMTIAYPEGVPPWITPGTTWDEGTDFVMVDDMPAVHFSAMDPFCRDF